jgi:protein SCO1/2
MIRFLGFTLLLLCFYACNSEQKVLPILGEKKLIEKTVDGKKVIDTVNHRIGSFSFKNQLGNIINEKTVDGKVYVADFFFTSCPTICPAVKAQMKKIYDKYKNKKDFLILSYSIDPKRDTIGRLAWYAKKLNVDLAGNWHFLTGKESDVHKLAQKEYISHAEENPEEPGGFGHSVYILLVDRNRQIRGAYDGTDPKKVEELMRDIPILLNEKEK